MVVVISKHFVERYRERLLEMAPSMYNKYTGDFFKNLAKTMKEVIPKCDKILFKDLDEDKQAYLHKKYEGRHMVYFERKGVIYVGAYVKNKWLNDVETVLLLTLFRK